MTEFIGKGERSAIQILHRMLNLHVYDGFQNWPLPGIYLQVPIHMITKKKYYGHLREEFQKHTVDIVVITNKHKIIAFPVDGKGHQGDVKAPRDRLIREAIEDSGNYVVVIPIWACREVFKEKVNYVSFYQISALMTVSNRIKVSMF